MRRIVGRAAEIAELTHGLDEAHAGRGRLYLLSGEPGIGKTRLADEVDKLAHERAIPALWGRAWEAGGAPAYWPWLAVLSAMADGLDDVTLAETLGEGAAAFAELVPAVGARLAARPQVATSPDESRFRLFRAVSALVRRTAMPAGLLVVLEDLHAADGSSVLLLRFVARELRSTRAVFLVTFRDVEARLSVEIGEVLGRLTREGTTISLARLGENDAQQFVRDRVGELAAGVLGPLIRRAQGNPLFLEQMAQLLRAEGAQGLVTDGLPIGVRDLIRQRLSRVSGQARPALEMAAAFGDEVEQTFIAEAAALPLDAVASAFAEAIRGGIVFATERRRFRFSHALMREVLARDLVAAKTRELHARIAATLERRAARSARPPYAELAHHLLEAGAADLPRTVEYALRASERALALFAYEDAIALLERTDHAVERAGDPPELSARVKIALGRAHIRSGAGTAGQALCLEAATIARVLSDPTLLCQAALSYGLEITAALVDPTLVAVLKEALAALPEHDSALRVQVTARLAAAMQPAADLGYPIGLAQRAIASARRLNDRATLLDALFTGMSAMMDITDPRERLRYNLETEQLASSSGDTERLLRTDARLVFDHMELGDFAAADARIDVFARRAEDSGAARYLWRVPLFRSMRALCHGRFADAELGCREALRLGLAAQDPQLERCYTFHWEGVLRASERHHDMLAYDPEARRMRAALYSGPHWQNGGSAFAYSRLEDLESARMYIGFLPPDDWPLVHNPPAFAHLGEPFALVGDQPLVQRLYDLLLPAAHRCVSWGFTGFVWDGPATRVLGMLAARLGRWDAARSHFEQALALLERLDARPYLMRTRYEYGRALLECGDATEQALSLLEAAREGAQRLGMSGLVKLAERRLGARAGSGRGSAPVDMGPRAARASGGLPFAFSQEGEYWSLAFAGSTFRLRDSLGLQYLGRLWVEPNRAIHVLELSGGNASGNGDAIDAGDAGELLDDRAKATYRRRLGELREQLDEAEAHHDLGRAERAKHEIEFLSAELSRAVGLGGRTRRAGGAAERARTAVQRRIRNAIERIRQACPALADLLEVTVKTGTVCVFSPDQPRR
jgi:hypothetical protein